MAAATLNSMGSRFGLEGGGIITSILAARSDRSFGLGIPFRYPSAHRFGEGLIRERFHDSCRATAWIQKLEQVALNRDHERLVVWYPQAGGRSTVVSIANDRNGCRRILFCDSDGRRKTVRLGKCERRSAEYVARHIESLLGAKFCGHGPPLETAVWTTVISPTLRTRLAAAGLIERRSDPTTLEFLTRWLQGKREMGYQKASIRTWLLTISELNARLGSRRLSSVSRTDGEEYRTAMLSRGLRPATIHKRLGHARQMFEDAVRLGHIPENPWRYVRHRGGNPSERRAYVPIDQVELIIGQCPNDHWKLLVAMAQFGGFRVPSEAFSLSPCDVDWKRGRIDLASPKTENSGKPRRIIPLFPALRQYFEAVLSGEMEGNDRFFPSEWIARAKGRDGWAGVNLRTTFEKIIFRAGVEPWPRLWHSLRSSCESDLAQSFPLATVTKWLGNTPSIALRHYVDPTDAAFVQALDWWPEGCTRPIRSLEANLDHIAKVP